MTLRHLLYLSLIYTLPVNSQTGTWKNTGPILPGRVSGIVASPSDPNLLIASSPGGGIWKSSNGGKSWIQTGQQGLADFTVVHLEWDRLANGRLYASTLSDLYVSTDMGNSWTNLTRNGGMPAATMPLIHKSDPGPFAQLLYPGGGRTIFWSKPGYGIYYSNDGINFKQHFPFSGGVSNLDNFIQHIAADDATGKIYFTTMYYEGFSKPHLYKSSCAWTSTNPCLTWELFNTGLPAGCQARSIAWAMKPNKFMITLADQSLSKTYVYYTTDGYNWQACKNQPALSLGIDNIYAISATQIIIGAIKIYGTTDFGQSWSNIHPPSLHSDIRSIYFAKYPVGSWLWAGADGSWSNTNSWAMARWQVNGLSMPSSSEKIPAEGMQSWQTYYFAVSTKKDFTRKRFFTGSQDNSAAVSDDGGFNWQPLKLKDGCADKVCLIVAPSNPDRAYSLSCDPTVLCRSDNAFSAPTGAEVTWTNISLPSGMGLPFIWSNACMGVDPSNPDRICMASFFKVSVSMNGGQQWTHTTLPESSFPVSVFMDTDQSIMIGTEKNGIYRSTDNGVSWVPFGLNTPGTGIVLKVIRTKAGGAGGTYFAATSKGLFRKLPGETFKFLSAAGDSNYIVSDIEADPVCPSRIYLAKGFLLQKQNHRGGVMVSHNNGNSFTSISVGQNIHQSPISDIMVDPIQPRYLYVASYGLGTWVFDSGNSFTCQ